MTLQISSTLLERLLSEAAGSPDREVCGLLFGTAERIEAVLECRNVAADPSRHFEIDPTALFAAIRTERAGGPQLVGYWHSHPGGDVEPSASDLEGASDDGKIWLIVAGDDVAAWRVQVSEIFGYGENAKRQWNDEFGRIVRPTSSGRGRKTFRHVPLATGQIRHLVPRDRCDEDLLPLIAKAGYPAIAPILDDLMAWTADPNWPIAGPLIDYLATLGEPMVEPIRRVLRSDDDCHKFVCLRRIVRGLPRALQLTLRDDLSELARVPRESGWDIRLDEEANAILVALDEASA